MIKEFKKELDAETDIVDTDKDTIYRSFLDTLFKGTAQESSLPAELPGKPMEKPKSFVPSDEQTFAGLINKTNIKQHPDVVLLAIYYLVKYKQYPGVTVGEIEDQYKSALIKKSSNTRMFINVNKKKGYIMDADAKEDKTAWIITRDGQNYIEGVLKDGNKE